MAASASPPSFSPPSTTIGSVEEGIAGNSARLRSQPQSKPQPQSQPHQRPFDLGGERQNQEPHKQQQQQQQKDHSQLRPPAAKRRRIGYACNLCRAKKNRCDGERPACGSCRERRQDCIYSPHRTKISVTQEYIENLRARNRMLEEHLAGQQLHASSSLSYPIQSPFIESRSISDQHENVDTHQYRYQDPPSPVSTVNGQPEPLYQHHAEGAPRREDHGPESVSRQLQQAGNDSSDPSDDKPTNSSREYFGESSAFDFIAKVASPNSANATTRRSAAVPTTPMTATTGLSGATIPELSTSTRGPVTSMTSQPLQGRAAEVAGPYGASNIESLAESSPSTVVFEDILGLGRAIEGESGNSYGGSSDLFELPQRSLADRLVESYFRHRHPLNPYLHEGTFRRRYTRLWLSQDVGGEEAAPHNLAWLGLVNMVFAFGSEHAQMRGPHHSSPAVSVSSSTAKKPDRARFFKRAKTLIFSSILQAKIELVQALLLMSHYLHGSLELNHCWTVTGLAIRTAQELGLYLDPANFTTDIVEQEIRKRVWWGCFVIERNLSIKVGRPPTIHDTPTIQVGLPLAVDDEFLNEASTYTQPSHLPSKLEFFNQIVAQCRLVEKVLNTLYDQSSKTPFPAGRDTRTRIKTNLPDLLASSVQLDGALVAWQAQLPRHLRPDANSSEWHFERQKNVLLMRFLHTRLLIHRQTLLYYISRRISDPFQLDLTHPCIRRCVMAAYDSITQARLLRQYNLLSSSWHNSHYVFTALGVLLVYQNLDPYCQSKMEIPSSLDIGDVISQGVENLQRVGGEIHPLASRYINSFQQLRTRLQAIGTLSANAPSVSVRSKQLLLQSTREDGASGSQSDHMTSSAVPVDHGINSARQHESTIPSDSADKGTIVSQVRDLDSMGTVLDGKEGCQEPGMEHADDGFMLSGFDDDFAMIQDFLLNNSEWGSGSSGLWE